MTRSLHRSTPILARAAAFDFDVVTDAPPRRPGALEPKDSQPDPKSVSPAPVSEAAG